MTAAWRSMPGGSAVRCCSRRLWQELGIGEVLDGLLAPREFSFAVERAVFVATLHRLFVSGSDRDCVSWMADYDIGGAQALCLHHFTARWRGSARPSRRPPGLPRRRVASRM